MISKTDVAQICHEANRAYCQTIGDDSQVPWEQAPAWQRESAVAGVEYIRDRQGDIHAGMLHGNWAAHKIADGWKHGDVKDPEAKTHPCLVPFDQLPVEQQVKDDLFLAIAEALLVRMAR